MAQIDWNQKGQDFAENWARGSQLPEFPDDTAKEQFTEWLEQLRFVKDEVETNLDASAFFEEDGF